MPPRFSEPEVHERCRSLGGYDLPVESGARDPLDVADHEVDRDSPLLERNLEGFESHIQNPKKTVYSWIRTRDSPKLSPTQFSALHDQGLRTNLDLGRQLTRALVPFTSMDAVERVILGSPRRPALVRRALWTTAHHVGWSDHGMKSGRQPSGDWNPSGALPSRNPVRAGYGGVSSQCGLRT